MKSSTRARQLICFCALLWLSAAHGAVFTTLHSFTATAGVNPPYDPNSDGANPYAGLVLSGSTLYGTARYGGGSGFGAVFVGNTDGTGFTNLYSFTSGSDGDQPTAGLVLSSNTLYGTALFGGSPRLGSVFKVNTNSTGFTNLHIFTGGSGGAYPDAGLILSGNTLYGATGFGGSADNGTIFAVNIDGTGFTNLHNFTAGIGTFPQVTNSDGVYPFAGLILSGDTLFGTARGGGSSGNGTIFAININGTGFTNLHNFTAGIGAFPQITNSDGVNPFAGLILSGNTLYGTASGGGSSGNGTIFAINTNGTGFTNLHSFSGTTDPFYTNSDGAFPVTSLILSGNTLYGTADNGGSSGNGAVFGINTDGRGFTNLHSFTAISDPYYTNSDGAIPRGRLIVSGNTLYGTASGGGSSGNGTVFSLSLPLPPQLTIIRSGANVILTWPTNAVGFTLESTTNLVPPAVWITNSPAPVVVNGQYAVTNPISGTQKFYRLQ